MKNPLLVMMAMVAVEVVLYTICLCAPQWLVLPGDASVAIFASCQTYENYFSCTAFPAWNGPYSLTWIFLAGSCVLSFLALFTIRTAILMGSRAAVTLILNTLSVLFCILAVVAFLVSLENPAPLTISCPGWSFYISCAVLFYSASVSVLLGLVKGASRIEPVTAASDTLATALGQLSQPPP